MMKHLKEYALLVILFSAFLAGCRALEEEPEPDKTEQKKKKTEKLLTTKSWIIYKFMIEGTDLTPSTNPCTIDNIFTFYPNGDYLQAEGPVTCSDPRTSEADCGYWNLNNDGTKFALHGAKFHETMDIVKITNNDFHLQYVSDTLGKVEFYLYPVPVNTEPFVCVPDTTPHHH